MQLVFYRFLIPGGKRKGFTTMSSSNSSATDALHKAIELSLPTILSRRGHPGTAISKLSQSFRQRCATALAEMGVNDTDAYSPSSFGVEVRSSSSSPLEYKLRVIPPNPPDGSRTHLHSVRCKLQFTSEQKQNYRLLPWSREDAGEAAPGYGFEFVYRTSPLPDSCVMPAMDPEERIQFERWREAQSSATRGAGVPSADGSQQTGQPMLGGETAGLRPHPSGLPRT